MSLEQLDYNTRKQRAEDRRHAIIEWLLIGLLLSAVTMLASMIVLVIIKAVGAA